MKLSLSILVLLSGFTAVGLSPTVASPLAGETNALYSALGTNSHRYLVKSGDTDVIIARKFGMTRKALQAANPDIPMARLRVGQALAIPAERWVETNALPKTVAKAPDPSKAPPATTPYVVSRRDTAKKIAKKHGISVSALLAANPGLDPARMKAGQVLAIPQKQKPTRSAAPAKH